jgi:hypothetical protein
MPVCAEKSCSWGVCLMIFFRFARALDAFHCTLRIHYFQT